ncbi:MAG: FG-GAP-like repeat-containing protein [Caldilineaceae bacterium]
MQKFRAIFIFGAIILFCLLGSPPSLFAVSGTTARLAQSTFAITATTPDGVAMADLATTIRVTFSADVNMATVNAQTFVVQSHLRGRLSGSFAYEEGTRTLTFTPTRAFAQGEGVTVIATDAIRSNSGATLAPYQWRFTPGHLEERCIEKFIPYEENFTSVWSSTAAWGDYDNDGDLDVVVAGQTSGNRVTFVYRNDGGNQFSPIGIGLPGIREGSVAWGDYDNDGDLDILLAGESSSGLITQIYRNDGNSSFVNSNITLPGIWVGEATWLDYNNDGYLDVFITGQSSDASISRLYRNNQQGGFVEIPFAFVGANNSSADWGDYDNDGDLDLLLAGEAGTAVTIIYRNDGNDAFVNLNAGLTGVRDSAVAWGDYNGDGYDDILLTGNTAAFVATTIVYRNNGDGTFTNSGASLIGVSDGAVAWGDYDNDGDFDILLNGKAASEESTTRIYNNTNGNFTATSFVLPAVSLGSAGWGDYDNDLDLDILLTGLADDRIVTGVYQNFDCPSDVAITKAATPHLILTTQPVTFTITFVNHGPVTATSVLITDIIPSALTNVQVTSATSNPAITLVDNGANPGLGWDVSDLPLQQGGTITISGELVPEPGAVYTNTAQIAAARDVTLTNNVASAAIMAPFRITQTSPQGGGTLSATPGGPIALTFEAAINPATVNGATLKAMGSQSGYLGLVNPSYNAGNRTYSFHTNRAWKMGETISIIGTAGVKSSAGAPLLPYQWQFTGGRTSPRCVGEFTHMAVGLPAVANGAVAWGDYDGDGDLDLVLIGQSANGRSSGLYRTDGGLLVKQNAPLTNIDDGAVAWGDYDGDGDLDLLLTGHNGVNPLTNLYRNDSGSFIAINPPLPPVANSAVAWGDYDSDGDLDLLLAGNGNSGRLTRLYRNDNLTFTDSAVSLPGITDGAVTWGDYDNDGDLDLLISGNGDSGPLTVIYRNNGDGSFTDSNAGLMSVTNSAVAWGDYDNDSDLDLLLTGNTGAGRMTQLYRNDGGALVATNPALPALENGAVAWGDYDNDGVLDLFLAGQSDSGPLAAIYRQQGGVFTDFGAGLTGVTTSAAAWGDYDRDGDVDLILTGASSNGPLTTLRRNTNCISDTRISKTVQPTAAEAGAVITYTLTFSNAGPQPALGVQLVDQLPVDLSNVQIISTTVSAGVAITPTAVATSQVWQVSNLAVGQGGVITVTATLRPGTPGAVFTNTAVITSIHDITLTNNLAAAPVGRPFHIIGTTPEAPVEVGVPLAIPIQATFDADLNPTTATTRTIAVYGQQSGLRTGTVQYDQVLRTLAFTPSMPLHHGEVVDVIGLAALRSVAGAPLAPYQWQFVAGRYVDERCIAEFKPVATVLPAMSRSTVAWGDYDRDGDLDVALIGSPDGTNRQSKLYRNDSNGLFTDSGAPLAALSDGAVAWGDYDKDGDLDLLLTGAGQFVPATYLYRNDGGSFSEAPVGLPGVANSSAAWGDYDNDGYLDLALTGTMDGSNGVTLLYHKNGAGGFTNSNVVLTGVYRSAVLWGDADGDGDLDLLLTGTPNGNTGVTQLYRNDSGAFVNLNLSLPGLYASDAAWGDYDNDSDLDLILMGTSDGTTRFTTLLRNDGGMSFTGVTTPFPGLSHGSVAWGDYENDGDLDLLLTGTANGTTPLSRVFINDGAQGFRDAGLPVMGIFNGVATWHDYDGDADLDLLFTGATEGSPLTQLYRSLDCVSDLTLAKTVTPSSVLPGELITYTLTFNNIGPQPATRVMLTDTIPLDKLGDLQINSSLPITQVGPPYIWRLPNIAPGAGGVITIVGRPTFLATGVVITNTATIRAREDLTPTNDVAIAPLSVRPPVANFAVTTASASEQDGQATITVTLSEPNPAGAVTLSYAATPGTAQAGDDYGAVSSLLTIPTGQTTATFVVPIVDDALDEDDETMLLTLSNPVGAVLGATTTMTFTIVDDDGEPTLSIANITANENSGSVVFLVSLNVPSGRTVSVTANTMDGTATAPADYSALTNLLVTIPPGQTSTTVVVQLVDDDGKEESEQFTVVLSDPVNVTLLASQATGTVIDNDDFALFMPIIRR